MGQGLGQRSTKASSLLPYMQMYLCYRPSHLPRSFAQGAESHCLAEAHTTVLSFLIYVGSISSLLEQQT